MVDSAAAQLSRDRTLPWRSAAYTIVFLAFVLVAVPYGFHYGVEHIRASLASKLGLQLELLRHWIGAAVFIVGLAAYLFCSCWLMIVGKGPHVEFDPPRVFVATGPYRWVRNPVVIALVATVLGEALYFASPGILLLVLLGLPFAQYQVTRIEEPRLRARFGQSYLDYCARVRRWWPRRPRDEPAGRT